MIHRLNEIGMSSFDPKWAGGPGKTDGPLHDDPLDLIQEVLYQSCDRVFASGELGPLGLHLI